MATPLEQDIKGDAFTKRDLVAFMANIRDLVNDMKDAVNELVVDAAAQRANLNSFMVSAIAASLTTATYTPPTLTAATVTVDDLTMLAG